LEAKVQVRVAARLRNHHLGGEFVVLGAVGLGFGHHALHFLVRETAPVRLDLGLGERARHLGGASSSFFFSQIKQKHAHKKKRGKGTGDT
jgi:hypothetical protein